jgi:hypothetical protein
MEQLLAFILSWVSTLSGVALGGFLVYRTKRDSYEPFWGSPRQSEPESYNVSDLPDEPLPTSSAHIPKPVQVANDAFLQQFAEGLADREGKDGSI